MAERSHAGSMQATAKWRQVEFSGDWGPASWSIREIRDSQLKLTWGRAAGPVPVEGVGTRAGPTVPQMPTPGTVVSSICESLLSLNVLAIWEFGLIGCQRSQGGWPAGIREKKGKERRGREGRGGEGASRALLGGAGGRSECHGPDSHFRARAEQTLTSSIDGTWHPVQVPRPHPSHTSTGRGRVRRHWVSVWGQCLYHVRVKTSTSWGKK